MGGTGTNRLGAIVDNRLVFDPGSDFLGLASGTTAEVIVTEFRTFDGLLMTAQSMERDEGAWVSFAATVDETLPAESEATRAAAEAEAAEINGRVQGWRYKIPTYKFEQLTREIADLLQAVD